MPARDLNQAPEKLLLLRSSRVRWVRLASSGGRLPWNWLLLRSSFKSELRLQREGGREPDRELLLRSRIKSSVRLWQREAGNWPENLFPESMSRFRWTKLPSSTGSSPAKELSTSTRDCRLLRWPRLAGISPTRPRFERNSRVCKLPASFSHLLLDGTAVGR